MLTLPKWQTVWLKCQYSSRNIISNKKMFCNPADRILDDLSKCCNSASKELALEALSCWRIWIENQQVEDWKLNETCYVAVRPLLTKKFHPLYKDGEVSEMKLGLLWLALHKTQGLMHLEGPQHILEVFIQSCLSWLTCDDLDFKIRHLVIKLLKFLFLNNLDVEQENEKFPPLSDNIWKSNKLFCRLLTLLLEIFLNWTKINEKTDLLCIWNHFLDHCEKSFKLIPVPVWHKIFKLVESICSDDNELMKNKISLLHRCTTSLQSVLSNSKFIDCSQVLTTPAEALLKIVIELCVNNKEENITFDIFQYCSEISQVLSSRIIHTFGYESCVYNLAKIEDIESKPLLWGLWCGLVNCFKREVENVVDIDNYTKIQLKLYRKLRSVAANFDLDRMMLEEKCVILIQKQLDFLRIVTMCENCSGINKAEKCQNIEKTGIENSEICLPILKEKEEKDEFGGIFGFELNSAVLKLCKCSLKSRLNSLTRMQENDLLNPCGMCRTAKPKTDFKWVRRHSNLENRKMLRLYQLLCDNVKCERLIKCGGNWREGVLIAPSCLSMLLEDLCIIAHRSSIENFVEKVKKVQNKVKEGPIFAPINLLISFKGNEGLEFCMNAIRYWNDLNQIMYDVDFSKNLIVLKGRNEKSVVWLSMFLFLANFTKNLHFEDGENTVRKNEFDEILTGGLVNFMRRVTHYKTRFSNFSFLESMNKVLPTKQDNPLVIWTNRTSAMTTKANETVNGDAIAQEISRTSNDNFINIFNYFDELQSKIFTEIDLIKSKNVRRKPIRCQNETGRFSPRLRARKCLLEPEVKIMENESVTVLQAPPNVFVTLAFSEWRTDPCHVDVCKENILNESIKSTPKRRRSNRVNASEDVTPQKKSRRSTQIVNTEEVIQDENVNIENIAKKCKSKDSPARNVTLTPGGAYSLRKRPLQRPSKFKDTCLLEAVDFTKRKISDKASAEDLEPCSPVDNAADEVPEPEEMVEENPERDELPENDNPSCNTVADCDNETNEESKDIKPFAPISMEKAEVRVKVEDPHENADLNISEKVLDLVNNLIVKVEKEAESDVKVDLNVKLTDVVKEEPDDVLVHLKTKVRRRVKRRFNHIDESILIKKFKWEWDDSSEVEPEEESLIAPLKLPQKLEMPVIQNRGLRMLALVPESPKLNGFHDSPPSSKHHAIKPPNVMMNSRASKMLALLPELQEIVPNAEAIAEKTEDDAARKEKMGSTGGIMHHLTPGRNGFGMNLESPKRSPLRQRRSIRFDDDRNETVTYFTDSPPCQTIKQGMRFRGCEK